ncbi:hypothetical protein GALMADRAFT_229677 [Galerina marginata CBS 339.88]|uniref:Uncharacterized protein n=1 Tax=Galerina marginata (strain CBS 339.88) TaxID=685588 RepID=A0A067SMX9_GALM3|nr:hypothetical protein GALMADRAFT_229677 [Galerina marginata CBS 339.88]
MSFSPVPEVVYGLRRRPLAALTVRQNCSSSLIFRPKILKAFVFALILPATPILLPSMLLMRLPSARLLQRSGV